MRILAIIPAAGKGARFGMPKVDAVYNGLSFGERIVSTLNGAGINEYIIVRDVDTPDMLSSIRWGVQRVLSERERPDGWLIWPVDHPTVRSSTVQILCEVFARHGNSVVIPQNQGKSGHPLILPGAFIFPPETNPLGLKGVIMQSDFPLKFVDVDDVGILFNFNTQEDVKYV